MSTKLYNCIIFSLSFKMVKEIFSFIWNNNMWWTYEMFLKLDDRGISSLSSLFPMLKMTFKYWQFHAYSTLHCALLITYQLIIIIKLYFGPGGLHSPTEVAFAMRSWPLLLPTFVFFFGPGGLRASCMFHNCAIARNGAILEHFYELLRNHNSDL